MGQPHAITDLRATGSFHNNQITIVELEEVDQMSNLFNRTDGVEKADFQRNAQSVFRPLQSRQTK
jgi:hypothetical protein